MSVRIGLDVGGTKILAVALDDDGGVAASVRHPTGWGADAVVDGIARAIGDVAPSDAPISIGIGIPGQIAPGSGVVHHALNLGIDELDIVAAVAARVGVAPVVDNDVRAAAVGAASALPELSSLAYLNLGTGIAAGLVSLGAPWLGGRGAAGEIGHVSIDPTGPQCRCGQRGCIEALAGGGAVAERWGRPTALPVRDVFDAADAGDTRAQALRTDVHRGVAAAVQLLILTADVDAVVLGGGVAGLGSRLSDPVRDLLRTSASASPFLRSLRLDERVRTAPDGVPLGAVGAALLGAAPDVAAAVPSIHAATAAAPNPEVAARG